MNSPITGQILIFRFADVFGLDLADVKTFLDEVPRVPRSAFRDLKDAELSDIESDSGSGMTSLKKGGDDPLSVNGY